MKIELEFPYDNYIGYTIINREERKTLLMKDKVTKNRKTISYARYLMSVNLGRILNPEEHVDHIDGDKTNDDINNLQILTISENNKKRNIENGTTRKMISLKCPNCNIEFTIEYGKSFLQKNNKFSTCSKKCLHSFLKVKRTTDELIEIGKNQIIEIFRR